MSGDRLHYVVVSYRDSEYRFDIGEDRYTKDQRDLSNLLSKPISFCWWYDPAVVSDDEAIERMRQATLDERQAALKEIEGQIAELKSLKGKGTYEHSRSG